MVGDRKGVAVGRDVDPGQTSLSEDERGEEAAAVEPIAQHRGPGAEVDQVAAKVMHHIPAARGGDEVDVPRHCGRRGRRRGKVPRTVAGEGIQGVRPR